MAEMTGHIPMTWVSGTVLGAFDEFEVTVTGAKGFRCRACGKDFVVAKPSELPAHDCTGSYDQRGPRVSAL